jgi:toxin HigB-1
VIRTFRHKGLKELFETGKSKSIPADMRARILRRLDVLDAAQTIAGVNVPGFNLHPLKGNRAGEWSITVTGNYRITFRFENGDAHDLNFEDYH